MKKIFLGNVKRIKKLNDTCEILFRSLYGEDEIRVVTDADTAETLRRDSSGLFWYQIYYEEGKESEGEISLFPYELRNKREAVELLTVSEEELDDCLREIPIDYLFCEEEY